MKLSDEPTKKELVNKARALEKQCTYCRPHKGENKKTPKRSSKPKGKR